MPPILFYIFSLIMLGFGIGVIANRNPVSSAFCMVVSFLGLAALFISLDAYFIGTIQILVYAGAIMVLFLFIIMLLDLKAEKQRRYNLTALGGGLAVVAFFIFQLSSVLESFAPGRKILQPFPEEALANGAVLDDVRLIGTKLFTDFNYPLQIVAILLLVSTVGVVVLSKRELK